jgi:RNase P subunit RPR2
VEIFPFYLIIILILVAAGYYDYQRLEEEKNAWRGLAADQKLTFVPGQLFGSRGHVYGRFRGHDLTLETINKKHGKQSVTYTQISLDPNWRQANTFDPNQYPLGKALTVAQVTGLLTSQPLVACQSCKLTMTDRGRRFSYEQRGLETNPTTLVRLFNLLSDMAENYQAVVTLSSDSVPALEQMADEERNPLHHLAEQLLEEIAEQSRVYLAGQALNLFCPICLTHCGSRQMVRSWWRSLTFYGCRTCGQSRTLQSGPLVATLDHRMIAEVEPGEVGLRVNWLQRRAMFDFSEVYLVNATDEDVERFAVQVGNDTDPLRKARTPYIRCFVAPACGLSTNTLRILKRMFGEVISG